MTALFLTTIITCGQAHDVINRIRTHKMLSNEIKVELINLIRETIPSCPVVIKKDAK
jgi:hypothetical protein